MKRPFTKEQIKKASWVLTSPEYRVISPYYGLDSAEPKTRKEIAEKQGVSMKYIADVLKVSHEKISRYYDKK